MADTTSTTTNVKVGDISSQIEIISKLDVLTDMFWIQTKGDNQNNPQSGFLPAQQLIAYLLAKITNVKQNVVLYFEEYKV